MLKKIYRYRYGLVLCTYLALWTLVQLCFLTDFPFVHSDEAWLGGLSRNMLEQGSMGVTETFFDAKPRYPHAIKSLFHLLQMGAIRLFGYSVTTLRLVSLAGGVLCLLAFWLCAKRLLHGSLSALLLTILFSVDIQFIYAAHFARQEIWLCFALCVCLYLLLDGGYSASRSVVLAVATGLCIGLHPNSFLVGCLCGVCLLARYLQNRKQGLAPLAVYIAVTAGFAAFFVAVSYSFDPQFVSHYLAYGQGEFELLVPLGEKALGLGGFFTRLFAGESGTYYLPDIRLQLLLFPTVAVLCLAFAAVMHREEPRRAGQLFTLLEAGLGLLAGMVLIGRFNQTSILFLFPIGWLLAGFACALFGEKMRFGLLSGLLAGVLLLSVQNIRPWLDPPTYEGYMEQLAAVGVSPDARVLGNLNMDFYFKNGSLRDYRNLPFALRESTLEAYIRENKIDYILYSDELDYLYEHRPYYNVIYGNILFREELQAFCREHCTPMGAFQNTRYGVRVVGLLGQEDYGHVTAYRVHPAAGTAAGG